MEWWALIDPEQAMKWLGVLTAGAGAIGSCWVGVVYGTRGIRAAVVLYAALLSMGESLKRIEMRVAVVTNGLGFGYFEADSFGSVTRVNRTFGQLAGRPSDDLLGVGWSQAIDPEHRQLVMLGWDRAVASRAEFAVEFNLVTPSGAAVPVRMRAMPMRGPDGSVLFYGGTVHPMDVAEGEGGAAH